MKSTGMVTLAALAIIAAAAGALAAPPQTYRVIYYTSYKCPPPSDKNAPGATPDHPLAPTYFSDPIDDEVELNERAAEEGKDRATSRFECKWIRVSGFFTPTDYYHYRGYLVADAKTHYSSSYKTPRFVVEKFNDPAMRRSAIGHRQVTIVGQFYYLCLTAPKGDDIMFLFGPCHYGGVQGMMLADVRIEKIETAAPQYLLGEVNRPIIGNIPPVEGDERTAIAERVRAWATLVQRGPNAYARETIDRNPDSKRESARERADDRARLESPDSYISYLYGRPDFRGLDSAQAEVASFWQAEANQHDFAIGCICLQASCTNEWPLTESDANNFYGHAACTMLNKRDGVWLWY